VSETLAEVVRGLRERTRLSQRDFAVVAKIGKNTLTNIESGKPGALPATLRLIAEAAAREAAGEHAGLSPDAAYNRMMVAAGYVPSQTSNDAEMSPEDVLTQLAHDPEIAALIAEAARKYPDMTPAQRTFFVEALRRL
jgi:transcriptional regulator with XRE-family HTH domain